MSHPHVLVSLVLLTLLSLSTLPSISATCEPGDPTVLSDGIPMVNLSRPAGNSQIGTNFYYSFFPGSSTTATTVTIALTMFTDGYAEIWVVPADPTSPVPCPAKNTANVVVPLDGVAKFTSLGNPRRNYWITVYVKNAAKFSVTATLSGASSGSTRLIDGYPQAGRTNAATALPTEWFQVRFPTPMPPRQKIRFYLLPLRGNAMFFVSTVSSTPNIATPSTMASTYSLVGQNEVIWDLADTSKTQPQNGVFYIGVQGVSYCQFFFTAHQFSTNAILVPGLPQRSSLTQGKWHYFTTRVANPSCKLSVVVTPFTGDPDLYGSATYLQPNFTWPFYDRSSTRGSGNDSIVYTTTAQDNEYGIGVYGWSNTSYSVVSVVDCVGDNFTDVAYLVMGQSQEGALATGQSMWYRVSVVDKHHDIQISITIEEDGDPDLYVSTLGLPRYNRSDSNSRSTFQWSSEQYGNDVVLIEHDIDNHDNPIFCPKEGQDFCDYYIQVYAFEGCTYSIVVTQSQAITQLRNGIALHEDLGAGSYEYFTMLVDQPNQALTVTVTDLGRGDPDLFIAVLTNFSTNLTPSMFPNLSIPNSYQWSQRRIGGDTIVIPPDASGISRLYLISVHAYTSTAFSIVATFNRSISLSPGAPQSGSVGSGQWVYYEFISNPSNPDDQAVSFVLQTTVGRADMYVSRRNYPTITNYDMRRRFNEIPQKLDVNHTLASSCQVRPCRYFVGIYGNTAQTRYSLTVHAGTNVQLVNGVPTSDTLTSNQWSYYEIFVPRNQTVDLSVIVTTISGDPDMYLTNATDGSRPTQTRGSYQWSSTRFGGDSIEIEQVKPGTYILGVLCFSGNCSYTVLSLLSSDIPDELSVIQLMDGQPQRGFLPRNHWLYFTMDHSLDGNYTSEVTYILTADYGDPDLYIKFNGSLPTLRSYDERAWAPGQLTDVIHLDNPPASVHMLGVHSYQTTMFTLLASVVRSELPIPIQPVDGETITVNDTIAKWRYFQMENVEAKSLNVVLKRSDDTPWDTPEIYATVYQPYPTSTDYIWKGARGLVQNVWELTIDTTDDHFTTGDYYIGVVGASYEVTFSFGETRALQDGVGVTSKVIAGTSKFFTFRLYNTTDQSVVVRASPCSGAIALYMDQTNPEPQPGQKATWADSSAREEERMLTITNGQFLSTNFYVGIWGISDSTFEIRVDNDNVDDVEPDIDYIPRTSASILVSDPTPTSVSLTFYPARSRLGAESLQYEIRYTTQTGAVLHTSCGSQNAQLWKSIPISTKTQQNTTTVVVDTLTPLTTYQFVIVVSDDSLGAPLKSVYTPTNPIQTPASAAPVIEESSSGSLKWLLGLGIPLFIVLAAGIVYLVIRNRRLTKELEVEMHDVPKGVLRRAVGRGVALEETDEEKAARTQRPFSNLLTDGDRSDAPTTSEDPDAYHPPDYARQL